MCSRDTRAPLMEGLDLSHTWGNDVCEWLCIGIIIITTTTAATEIQTHTLLKGPYP